MTQDEIIEMARQVAAQITIQANGDVFYSFYGIQLEAFAKLVAKHTLMNIDPSKFMSWQEALEIGAAKEREACAKVCEPQEEHDDPLTAWKIAKAIRARGQA